MFKSYTLPTFQGVFVGGILKGALPSNAWGRSHMPMGQLSLCATTTEPVLESPGATTEPTCTTTKAHMPWSPHSVTKEKAL